MLRIFSLALLLLTLAAPVTAQVTPFTLVDDVTFTKTDWETDGFFLSSASSNSANISIEVAIEYSAVVPECATAPCSYTLNAVLEAQTPAGTWIPVAQDTREFGQPSGSSNGPIRVIVLSPTVNDSGTNFSFTGGGGGVTEIRSFYNGVVDDDFRLKWFVSGIGTTDELTSITITASGFKNTQ